MEVNQGNLTPGARRTRSYRERKKAGLRVVPVQLFGIEVDELARMGWLDPEQRHDRDAIGEAVNTMLTVTGGLKVPARP